MIFYLLLMKVKISKIERAFLLRVLTRERDHIGYSIDHARFCSVTETSKYENDVRNYELCSRILKKFVRGSQV